MATPGIPPLTKRASFAGILLFGLLAMTARNAVDPDLGWHLLTGRQIVQTHQVPHSDSFSFTRAGSPWIAHEWLSEVVFYEIWHHGGPGALIVFSSLVTTSGFLLLYLRSPGNPSWAAIATVLGAWASASSWGARPQMFTFTLASLFLWLVEKGEARPRLLLWIPPLFLLWLNLHAGFALGPVLLLLYIAGLVLEVTAGSAPWRQARPVILRVLMATLGCLALVPLNPSGAKLYRYPFDTLRFSELRSIVVEWFSPDFHQWSYVPFLLLFLLLLTLLATSPTPIKGRVLLPLSFTFLAALDAVRHIPIFVLLAVPVISAALPVSVSAIPSPRHPFPPRYRVVFNVIVLLLMAGFALLRWTTLAHQQEAREATLYPQAAVAFLKITPQPARLFAYYDWGGYALLKLSPQYRVFADGRSDLYGDDIMRSFQTAVHLHQGWQGVLDTWDVQTVLIPINCALAQALLLDPHWSTSYLDSRAVIFARTQLPR